jgi:hypothetical protein
MKTCDTALELTHQVRGKLKVFGFYGTFVKTPFCHLCAHDVLDLCAYLRLRTILKARIRQKLAPLACPAVFPKTPISEVSFIIVLHL